jgi:hypothetical protein
MSPRDAELFALIHAFLEQPVIPGRRLAREVAR